MLAAVGGPRGRSRIAVSNSSRGPYPLDAATERRKSGRLPERPKTVWLVLFARDAASSKKEAWVNLIFWAMNRSLPSKGFSKFSRFFVESQGLHATGISDSFRSALDTLFCPHRDATPFVVCEFGGSSPRHAASCPDGLRSRVNQDFRSSPIARAVGRPRGRKMPDG